jgi:hypothetical protein
MGMKEAYQEKAEAQLREWHNWIERTKFNPTLLKANKTTEQQRVVERLEDSLQIAHIRLDELRFSQDERWELAKQAVERAMIDLKQALDESGASQAGKIVELQVGRAHAYEPFARKGY